MEMCSIPYEEYMNLLHRQINLECIIQDIRYLIDEAQLNYSGTDLLLDDDIKMLAKKHIRCDYECRLRKLIEERESEK